MQIPRLTSIRTQLALIFLSLFGMVIGLGLFSISLLHNFNRLSDAVAEEWLPTTRAIGDLNNFTSDLRAVEGSYLLASSPRETDEIKKEMARLARLIETSEDRFENIHHDPADASLYSQWKAKWARYQESISRQRNLVETGQKAQAIAAYMNASADAYNTASHILDDLTEQVVDHAQIAKNRLAGGYNASVVLIWLTLALVAAIIGSALFYIRRLISLPLRQLTDCMHQLARNDTDVNIPSVRWQNEIGEMAQAAVVFRNNAIDLMRSRSILASHASILEERLSQEQMLVANQRNFLAMASHEFRTPLTIIDGHARRISKIAVRFQDIAERSTKIRSAVLRMTRVIDNLLTSSRMMEGMPLNIARNEVNVVRLLREISQLHRDMMPMANIRETYLNDDVFVQGDQTLLFYAFSNIISNAIKYSPDGSVVKVEARSIAAGVVVAIIDYGIGIPVEDQEHLFERFHRGSNVKSIIGTGVGLSLAKMVFDLHGAKVEVESELGKGSSFWIQIPGAVTGDSGKRIELLSKLR